MHNNTSLKALIQQLMPQGNELIIGRVISENPIKVQALNDNKLIVSPIVPARLYGLKKGESVHMLVFNNGKKYYALDRAVS